MRGAYLACIAGSGVGAGGIIGGLVCKAIGHQKIQVTVTMALAGTFIAGEISTAQPKRSISCHASSPTCASIWRIWAVMVAVG